MTTPNTDDTSKEELRYKAQKIIQEFIDPHDNDSGHHSVVFAGKEILDLIDQHTKTMCERARIEEAKTIHDNIAVTFNLIERIQTYYKGDKNINVNKLQNLLCEHRERLAELQSTIKELENE